MCPKLIPIDRVPQAQAWVMGPLELAEILRDEFIELGYTAAAIETPRNEGELREVFKEMLEKGGGIVHPGLSFWAERPEFPQIAEEMGLVAISPSARTVSLCVNKVNLLSEAEAMGIPHLALSLDPVSSLREIQNLVARTGQRFPLVLKSLKGGAGFGVLFLRSAEDIERQVPLWFEQLERRYGDTAALLEKSPGSARHIVVPFAASPDGEMELLPWVDASLQSRWKRLIQFCPASHLDSEAQKKVEAYSRTWLQKMNFVGTGTIEFLVDGRDAFLIDVVARTNAAFYLWERTLGMKTVAWQLAAQGLGPKPVLPAKPDWGFGISMRLYAEDPVRQIPTPGFIQEMTEPREWNLGESEARWITAYRSHQAIPYDGSGVLGEVFVFSQDRKLALHAARKVLAEIWIAGNIQTNQRFLSEHLDHPFVKENLIHAGFTDDEFLAEPFPDPMSLKRMVSLLAQVLPKLGGDAKTAVRWVAGSQYVEPEPAPIQFLHGPDRFDFEGEAGALGIARFPDFQQQRFCVFPIAEDRWWVKVGSWSMPIRRVVPGATTKSLQPRERRLTALCEGRVHALLVSEGAVEKAHEKLVVLEALGTLVPHAAPKDVKLLRWLVKSGEIVKQGQDLATLELLP